VKKRHTKRWKLQRWGLGDSGWSLEPAFIVAKPLQEASTFVLRDLHTVDSEGWEWNSQRDHRTYFAFNGDESAKLWTIPSKI